MDKWALPTIDTFHSCKLVLIDFATFENFYLLWLRVAVSEGSFLLGIAGLGQKFSPSEHFIDPNLKENSV